VDEEVGDYYQSFDKWLKDTLPRSWGYCRDALRTRKECRDVPYDDYVQIPRCNSEQLKKLSSSVRVLPEVIEAAQNLPEKSFVAEMNTKHNQHIEKTETLKHTYSPGEMAEYKRYLTRKAGLLSLEPDDYSGTALAIAIDDNVEFDSDEAQETEADEWIR